LNSSFIFSFENDRKYGVKKVHILTFILLFLCSFVLFESANRFFIFTRSKDFITRRSFEEKMADIKLLFLGDSHFIAGIDSEQFDKKTFNLSTSGASYIDSYYILKAYINRLPSLKVVVLPLGLHSFSSMNVARIAHSPCWADLIDYEKLSETGGVNISMFNVTLLNESTGRKFFIKNSMDLLLRKNPREEVYTDESVESDEAFRRAKFHLHKRDSFDPLLVSYFKKILKLCNENNIAVVIVQMPSSRYYIEVAEKYIGKNMSLIENMKYDEYIYTNFNYLRIYENKDNYFTREGDHLNAKGQKCFSSVLSEETKKFFK